MYILPVISVILLVALDQLTKYLAVAYLAPAGSVEIIKGVLRFSFVLNDGAAFGLFSGGRWFFILFAVIILGFLCYYYIKLPKAGVYRFVRIALVFICAGAIGNFIDRILSGHVVDFIHATFINFPVFNVADIYVVSGSVFLGVLILFFIKEPAGESPGEAEGDEPGDE